jgi:hypothetical protein
LNTVTLLKELAVLLASQVEGAVLKLQILLDDFS